MKRLSSLVPPAWRTVIVSDFLRVKVHVRWAFRSLIRKSDHNLKGKLIVSLTSYPRRYDSLSLTLKTILTQSSSSDQIVLWVADEDFSLLPKNVLKLQKHGLTIKRTLDIRSYKKIIPLLEESKDKYIVTADDDVYYPVKWLSSLVELAKSDRVIIFHRGHKIELNERGLPLPYELWRHEIQSGDTSDLNFPTGMGGVLYPPHVFSDEVTDVELFSSICPTADDVWLFFMARKMGATWKHAGRIKRFRAWPGSQLSALMNENVEGGRNTAQIADMIKRYGFQRTYKVINE